MASLVRKATSAGFLPKAEEIGLKLVKEHPASNDLLELVGAFYQACEQREKAVLRYEELANRLQKTEQVPEYRTVLEKLVALRPEDHGLLARFSDFCIEQGDEAGVVMAAEKHAVLFEKEKEWESVLEQANQILELQPRHMDAMRLLVKAHEELGNSEEAMKARRELAELLHGSANAEEEAVVLKEMLRQNPNQPESLERLIALLVDIAPEAELVEWVGKYLDLHKEHPEKGLRLLRDLVKDRPRATDLRLLLARLYRTTGRMNDMVAEMQSIAELRADSEETEEATALYLEALEAAPDSLSTRSGLIRLLRQQGKHAEATEHSLLLARHLEKGRKLQEADAVYRELYDVEPENEAIYRGHAALLREMDSGAESMKKLRELAGMFKKQKRTEKAISILTELLEADPRNQEVRREIIDLKRDGGKPKQVVEELAALAKLLQEEGDEEGVVAARREAVDVLPESAELRMALIESLEEISRIEEAQQEALELAQLYSRKKNYDKGLAILENILETDPSSVQARRGRAMIYDAMGDEKRALAEYREMQAHMDKVPSTSTIISELPVALKKDQEDYPQLEIMPEYDFESFVVGPKNNFAFATAKAVAEHPGSARNPLFLYSDVGLGKTHLLHAIANHMKKMKPDIRILYTSTEYFTTELIDAIQGSNVTAFRSRHQNLDVLLLDDVQFLAGKERSQEEFFHIFNMLYQKQRQIVVTSDRPPKDIAHLNMRLRSRFGQGVIVDIQPPDQDLRLAILKAENERSGIGVPEAVLAVLSARISSNVRELKGAYNQLISQHEIGGEPLTEETANAIVDKFFVA